jgi:hypothetical protein
MGSCRRNIGPRSRMSSDEVFILRFWLESVGKHDEQRWRAQVRNVNTRQQQIANDIESAFVLIANRLCAVLSAEPSEKGRPH